MAKPSHCAELQTEFRFPTEFPYEFDSFGLENLNSPLESSVAGSTETESSDEEDFFAGLTRRLSQASLHESRLSQLTLPIINSNKTEIQKVRVISESPQSTLSGIGLYSGQSPGSSDGTPNETSRVPSPNTTPFSNLTMASIYAATEQVGRLNMNTDVPKFNFSNRVIHSSFPQRISAENQPTQFFNHNNLNQQCCSVWGRESKPTLSTYQHQLHLQNKDQKNGHGSVKCMHPLPQPAWHPQQPNQLGLGHSGSNVKRGCAGTGVFLPRQYVAPSDSHTKTTSAPVIVPAKVIHALNSNTDDPNATTQRFVNAYFADYNLLLARRNAILMQQKLLLRREEAQSYEIHLPHEWTY